MKVAILGFGKQGFSAYNYYQKQGAQITICDQNRHLSQLPPNVDTQLGDDYLSQLNKFDILVRTPFLHPDKIIAANQGDERILQRVTTASNQFFKAVTTPIIAVTGTKGKGTTCLLIEAILKQAGYRTILMGNIGIPPLDVVDQANQSDVVIFEIASFQTMDLQYSPSIGVCLNIAPEHLDWHHDYQDYVNCKAQLFAHQTSQDTAIFAHDDQFSHQIVQESSGMIYSYSPSNTAADIHINNQDIYAFGEIVASTTDIKLLGEHNRQNVCAAIAAVTSFTVNDEITSAIRQILQKTSGFPNRLEVIRTYRNITFINDAYASAPEASIAALKAVQEPKILIAGGHDKGVDLTDFSQAILDNNVKHLILIGETADTIANLITSKQATFSLNTGCQNMKEIITEALKYAQSGDAILLSTGCASFGMFKNYDDRSQQFRETVAQLS